MPFKSQAQRRWMHWAESHGKIAPGTAKKWEEHTPKDKPLPERVKEASVKSHLIAGGIGATLGAAGTGYLGLQHGERQRRLGQVQAANYILAGPHGQSLRNSLLTPRDIESAKRQGEYEERYMRENTEKTAFERGFEKEAVKVHFEDVAHAAELAGLGILAAPNISSRMGKPWSEKKKDYAEIGGLGILAAPSAYHFAKHLMRK